MASNTSKGRLFRQLTQTGWRRVEAPRVAGWKAAKDCVVYRRQRARARRRNRFLIMRDGKRRFC